jgi:hypothetical protein
MTVGTDSAALVQVSKLPLHVNIHHAGALRSPLELRTDPQSVPQHQTSECSMVAPAWTPCYQLPDVKPVSVASVIKMQSSSGKGASAWKAAAIRGPTEPLGAKSTWVLMHSATAACPRLPPNRSDCSDYRLRLHSPVRQVGASSFIEVQVFGSRVAKGTSVECLPEKGSFFQLWVSQTAEQLQNSTDHNPYYFQRGSTWAAQRGSTYGECTGVVKSGEHKGKLCQAVYDSMKSTHEDGDAWCSRVSCHHRSTFPPSRFTSVAKEHKETPGLFSIWLARAGTYIVYGEYMLDQGARMVIDHASHANHWFGDAAFPLEVHTVLDDTQRGRFHGQGKRDSLSCPHCEAEQMAPALVHWEDQELPVLRLTATGTPTHSKLCALKQLYEASSEGTYNIANRSDS